MAQPYIGEIRLFAGNFAPAGWEFCDGRLLPIGENEALFTLIGTTYGGDGESTFALPDLRGRLPIHLGQGPGLSNRSLGETVGVETVTLGVNQLPAHGHSLFASSNTANATDPAGRVTANAAAVSIYGAGAPNQPLNAQAITQTGGGQAHDNLMPSLCLSFIISLYGIYPTQS